MPNSEDQSQNPQQSEVEQRVQAMLGDPPIEPYKPVPQPAPKPLENDVKASPLTLNDEPTGAPPIPAVGSTISPTPTAPPTPNPPMAEVDHVSHQSEPNQDSSYSNLPDESLVPPPPQAIPTPNNNLAQAQPAARQGKIKRFFKAWLGTSKRRRWTAASATAILLLLVVMPPTRYFLLNSFGARSSAYLTVLDSSTNLPLRNVQVKLANASGLTNGDGQIKLEHIRLGRTKLVIEKRAFASQDRTVTLGWGSNPLGKFNIKPVGDQYAFLVKDWLNDKAIVKAEATTDGEASAFSDDAGKILLTVDPSEVKDDMTVTVKASGYRTELVKLDAAIKTEQPVSMVVARKQMFISNRSGKYDLYSIDIDGKNEKLVLPATGLERDDIVLVPHPQDEVAALVSSRVNARNSDGFLLSTLTLVNAAEDLTLQVAQSEQIQIVGYTIAKAFIQFTN